MLKSTENLAGFALLACWVAYACLSYWNSWPMDLAALYFAAHSYGQEAYALVYSPAPGFFWDIHPAEWETLAAAQGYPGQTIAPYVYPPLWAALLAPLAEAVNAMNFFRAGLIVNALAIAAMVWMAWRLVAPGRMRFLLWVLVSTGLMLVTQVVPLALELGQPQIVTAFLVLASFSLLSGGHSHLAGVVLALAAAVKLSPALLAVIFLMERDWRALGAFALAGAGFAGLSVAVAGWELHLVMLERVRHLDGVVLLSRINYALDALLFQAAEGLRGARDWVFLAPEHLGEPRWVGLAVRGVLLAGLVVGYLATNRCAPAERLWRRLIFVILLGFFCGPLGWVHYLILPQILLPGLVLIAPGRLSAGLIAGFAAGFSIPLFRVLASFPAGGLIQIYLGAAILAAVMAWVLLAPCRAGSKMG